MRNKFILFKCIVLGALSFPTPFLIIFYVSNAVPEDEYERFFIVMFLMLSGGIVGMVSYYKDSAIESMKDWFPSDN